MQKVVITGATGMIAVALSRFLAHKDIEVFCVSRPKSKKLSNIKPHPNIKIIECDLKNLSALPDLVSKNCDAFFHFGWDGTFGNSRNDAFLQELNIKYTLDAVNAANKLKCSVFVGAGSQAEYGRVEGSLKADTPVNPENGYGIAKYTAGKLSALLCASLGIRHVWTRILSVYGPNDGESTMIMSCIRSFLKGEHMAFTRGEQLWDYLYCDDAARALYLIAQNGKNGAVYPLGGGVARPLSEYILTIRDLINPSLDVGIGEKPYSENQVMHLCADLTSLTNDTGFSPQISFNKGINSTINWVKNNIINTL
jgi:nucleoside-diphosphate-sugar epimerase